jgi:hypothetical protein
MARTRKKVEDDLYSPLENYCVALNEYYKALRKAGFTTEIAFWMITDRDSHPDWLLPKMPDFDPTNPDHTDWEDDD